MNVCISILRAGASWCARVFSGGSCRALTSGFVMTAAVVSGAPAATIRYSAVEVCWTSRPNVAYRVEFASSLAPDQWTPLVEEVASGGEKTCVTDRVAAEPSTRFYRIVELDTVPAPAPFDLQPVSSWGTDCGESSGGCCQPELNPFEVSFLDVSAGGGPGVKLDSISTSFFCCSCVRRTKSFPLGRMLNSSEFNLAGWFQTARGPGDFYSVASMQIDLYQAGNRVALRTFAAENRPNNNCASGVNQMPEALLISGQPFVIPLSSFAGSVDFDEVRVHVQGYGCGLAFNSIALSNLRLTRQ